MFPFTKLGPFDDTEKKALLFACLSCLLFIVLLSVFVAGTRSSKQVATTLIPPPVPPIKLPDASERISASHLGRFRVVPENFSAVDFRNFSYGVYKNSDGKMHNLTLGEGQMWDDSGWFNLQDVYYKDMTGDGQAEAIVRLLRVRCSGSCDGGADLIYIYTMGNGKLRNLWQYETGSYADGCGLKTFTLGNKEIVMQLFGRCANQAMDYPGPGKFMIEDLTFIVFQFERGRFITKTIEYIPDGLRNVKNWEPEIWIY
jgi:hypothetical protein